MCVGVAPGNTSPENVQEETQVNKSTQDSGLLKNWVQEPVDLARKHK